MNARHEATWCALMVLVIVMGAVQLKHSPWLGAMQMAVGTGSLGLHLSRIFKRII